MSKIKFTEEEFTMLSDIMGIVVERRPDYKNMLVKLFDLIDNYSKEKTVSFEIPNAYLYGAMNGDTIENEGYKLSKKPKIPVTIFEVKI